MRPMLTDFCKSYPEATVEVSTDYAFRDLVSRRFDVAIRLGEKLEQDMVALPVGPSLRMVLVASPECLTRRRAPSTPDDLSASSVHQLPDGNRRWPLLMGFEDDGQKSEGALAGPLTFNERI
ncbi:LysR substrate binding domain-containing protein [Paraburkholderia sp. BL6669N2]|nr:LysR substrate binding domain-containing protein [Paraburkholderia sp. BL6669N2]